MGKYALLVINIISFAIVVLIGGPFGIYTFFNSADETNKMLKKIHCPLNGKQIMFILLISLLICLITYSLRTDLLGT